MGARARKNKKATKAEVMDQAAALGIAWRLTRPYDWDAIAVALDAFESGDRKAADEILPVADTQGRGLPVVIKKDRGGEFVLREDREDRSSDNLVGFLDLGPKRIDDSVFRIDDDERGEEITAEEEQRRPWEELPWVNEQLHWSDLKPTRVSDWEEIEDFPARFVYLPRLLAYGDYDNSSAVERSNYRVFEEAFGTLPGVITVYGSHGSNAIGLLLTVENKEIRDTLAALDNYPAIDDEDMSNLEQEMYEEAYQEWALRDFVRALESHHDIDLDETGEENWSELFWTALSAAGESGHYPFVEGGGGVVFPLEEMASTVELQQLADAGVTYTARD